MRVLVIGILLIVAPSLSLGSEIQERCNWLAVQANLAMTFRQQGIARDRLDRVLLKKIEDVEHRRLMGQLIDAAFEEPIEDTEGLKARAIKSFDQSIYDACIATP